MGFLKEFFSDLDKPAFIYTKIEYDESEKEMVKQLMAEKENLKRQLIAKRADAIETKCKLLE